MSIEKVPTYRTDLSERSARVIHAALEQFDGPGATAVHDQIDWLLTGIETGDRDLAAPGQGRDESPEDFGEGVQ